MAIAYRQAKAGDSGGYVNTFNIAYTSSVAAGSLLFIAHASEADGEISSITDTQGNTWQRAVADESLGGGTEGRGEIWYAMNANAGATTLTVNLTAHNYQCVIIGEYSGLATTYALDTTTSSPDASGSYLESHSTGTTGTLSDSNSLHVAAFGLKGSGTPSYNWAGWGGVQTARTAASTSVTAGARILSATTAQSFTVTHTGFYLNGAGMQAIFSETANTPGDPPVARRIQTIVI